MGVLRTLATIIFVVAVPVVLVTTTIRLVFNEPRVYRYAVDEYDAVQTTGIVRGELLRAGEELRAYLNNGDSDAELRIQVVQDNVPVPLFNQREVGHLRDVHDRIIWMNRVQLIAALYVLGFVALAVLWTREVSTRGLAWATLAASVLTLAGVGIIGALSSSGFEGAWERFHALTFSGNYTFNPAADRLIQIYPEDFWQQMVFFIGALIVAEAFLLFVGTVIYLGVTHRRRQPAGRLSRSQRAVA